MMKKEKPLSEKEVCICGTMIKDECISPNPSYFYIKDVKEAVERLKEELNSIKDSLTLFLRGKGVGECEEAYDKVINLLENDKIFGEFKK